MQVGELEYLEQPDRVLGVDPQLEGVPGGTRVLGDVVPNWLPEGEGPHLDFLLVPEPRTGKNRLHLDLRAADGDQAAEVARLESLGARRTDVGQGPEATWVVLADPEGNEFCLLAGPEDS